MAERRMFAKSIVQSGKFLRMPPTSRLLYYDLGMSADDDGVVEAYTVMTQTKATEDDLRVLIAKEYVKVLNDDLVTQICDWNTNNLIRGDRYHPSIYKDLLLQIGVVNQVTTNGLPSDNQMETEVRLGKDRLGKDKNNIVRHKYGQYENVLLSDTDVEKLEKEFPNDYKERIENLSNYMKSTGKTYKDHLATIRNWARMEKKRATTTTPSARPNSFHHSSERGTDQYADIIAKIEGRI